MLRFCILVWLLFRLWASGFLLLSDCSLSYFASTHVVLNLISAHDFCSWFVLMISASIHRMWICPLRTSKPTAWEDSLMQMTNVFWCPARKTDSVCTDDCAGKQELCCRNQRIWLDWMILCTSLAAWSCSENRFFLHLLHCMFRTNRLQIHALDCWGIDGIVHCMHLVWRRLSFDSRGWLYNYHLMHCSPAVLARRPANMAQCPYTKTKGREEKS